MPRWRTWLESFAFVALPAIAIVVLAWLVGHQLTYGAELHAFEAALLDHARRWHDGGSVYGPPDILFTPLLYAPGFWWMTAAVGWIVGLDITTGRIVAALALMLAMGCLFAIARRMTGDWRYGVVAAGLYAAAFEMEKGRVAIGLVDGPATALALAAALALLLMRGWRGALIAALLLVATTFTKQNMLVVVLAAGVWTALYRRDLLLPLIGASAIAGLGLATWLTVATDGWFATYVIEIPLAVPWRWSVLLRFPAVDLRPIWPALGIALAVLLWPRRQGERFSAHEVLIGMIAAALLSASWLGRLHEGGHVNTFIPAHAAAGLALAIGTHRLAPRLTAIIHGRHRHAYVPVLVALQFVLLAYDPRAYLPPSTGRADIAVIRNDLQSLPRPVFLPGDGYWLNDVTGAEPFATNDLRFLKGRPYLDEVLDATETAVEEGRFAAVVLPSFLVEAYRDELAAHYRFDRWVGPRDRRVALRHSDIVGWRTYPYAVFLRIR